ncbi:RloB family protein [Dyadobacter sp. 3J3]|uniref:RloB family protein n=1 Tax=Dyadobacter sp. 3J3 TaxID=2606600 RepID=UPI00135AD368|nr:RloB family protein [Dyadobacter sp. 3J3]
MEVDPWDIRISDQRVEDQLITFIIFCEDEVSEPLYFRSFGSDRVKINEIPNQRSKKLNLENAIQKCTEDGLMHFDGKRHKVLDSIDEKIWCVYDRDLEHTDLTQIKKVNDLQFDNAISLAEDAGIRVAWSNDCFELWILLHFEEVVNDQAFHRDFVYERLTEVFKAIPNQHEDLARITGHPDFYYKNNFKKRYDFLTSVLPLLKERRDVAIERSKVLQAHFAQTNPAYHLRNPCTMVHELVLSILDAERN